MSVSKTDPMVRVAKTKANQVLGSPLTISTQRVELITSKATITKEVSVLAKSGSEAKTRSHQEELYLKNTLSSSLVHPSQEE